MRDQWDGTEITKINHTVIVFSYKILSHKEKDFLLIMLKPFINNIIY